MLKEEDTVAITGGSKGIGYCISKNLLERGFQVFYCARNEPEFMLRGGNFKKVNIAESNEVANWFECIFKESNKIDILVNNAGIFGYRDLIENIDEEIWRQVVNTNILGHIYSSKYAIPLLRKSSHPLILNIGSIIGKFPRAGFSSYAISKYAQEALSQTLAQELSVEGIKVVTIYPSRISTDLRKIAYGDSEKLNKNGELNLIESVNYVIEHRASIATGMNLFSDTIKDIIR